MKCAVFGCKSVLSSTGDGPKFYTFPSRELHANLRKKWLKACRRAGLIFPGRQKSICAEHFTAADFQLAGNEICLNLDAVPSRNLTPPPSDLTKAEEREAELRDGQQTTPTRMRGENNAVPSISPVASSKEVQKCKTPIEERTSPVNSPVKPTKTYSTAKGFKIVSKFQKIDHPLDSSRTVIELKPVSKTQRITMNQIVSRRVIELSTCDDPFSEAAKLFQACRNIYKVEQKKSEEKSKGNSPNFFINKFKASEFFEVMPVSDGDSESSFGSDVSASSADFTVSLAPIKTYKSFAEFRTRSTEAKIPSNLQNIARTVSTTMSSESGLNHGSNTNARGETSKQHKADDVMSMSGYVRTLNNLNTAMTPVVPAKSSLGKIPADYSVTLRLRPTKVKKFIIITTKKEQGVQCELGLEKYRSALKLEKISGSEAPKNIPVITYYRPNNRKDQNVQCEMGVEALSTMISLNCFIHHLQGKMDVD